MEKNEKNDYPAGSSGGEVVGEGYGIRSFLHPTGQESPPNEVAQNNDDGIAENNRDQPDLNDDNLILSNWIDELDSERVLGRDDNHDSPVSSVSTGLESNAQVNDRASDKSDDLNGRPGDRIDITIYNYAGYIGFPNLQAGIGFAGYIGAPVLGQGGLALRLNGSNVEYNRPAVANGGHLGGVHGDQGGNNPAAQGQAQAGIVEILAPARDAGQNAMQNNNGNVFYYTSTTAHAYRHFVGEVLSEMFSLRDHHIFQFLNVTDYAGPITQICNNPDLADAMIHHIDCFKAMLTRKILQALANQILCVNAVMRLVNDAYRNREDWAVRFIQTVDYDLRIISDRASNRGCRTRAIIRYNWISNNVLVYLHAAGCQCNRAQN